MPRKSAAPKINVWRDIPDGFRGGGGSLISTLPPRPEGFPKLGQYVTMGSQGQPFVDAPIQDNVINQLQIERAARFDYLMLDQGQASQVNDTVRQRIRLINKEIKIIDYFNPARAFQCGSTWYGQEPEPGGCSHENFAWARWMAIGRADGLIWSTRDDPFDFLGGYGVDFAQAGIPQAMATLCLQWMRDPLCKHIFYDETLRGIAFFPDHANIDYTKSGPYANLAEWDDGYVAGIDEFYQLIRNGLTNANSDIKIMGNGGFVGPLTANGWMRENWPFQNAGDPANCSIQRFRDECALFVQPGFYMLTAWKDSAFTPMPQYLPPYTASNYSAGDKLRARHLLGVSCLVDNAIGCLTGTSDDNARGFCYDLWIDEFSVNPNGVATPNNVANKWWLGPRTAATAIQNGMHYASFQKGYVVCNDTGSNQTFTPPTSSKRILGSDSGNNGSNIGTLSVPTDQSIFMVRTS